MSLWITYRAHYPTSIHPVDMDPTKYTGIAVFDDELEALRFANSESLRAVEIRPGQTLETAIEENG